MNTASPLKHEAQTLTWNMLICHWWQKWISGSLTFMHIDEATLKLPFASYNQTVSRPRLLPRPLTQCQKWEHIWRSGNSLEKRWQWGFTTLNFHQTISTSTQSSAGDAGCLWDTSWDYWRTRLIDLLPMTQGQKVNPIIRPDIHSPTSPTPLMFTHIYTSHTYRKHTDKVHRMITVASPLLTVLSLFCLARHP